MNQHAQISNEQTEGSLDELAQKIDSGNLGFIIQCGGKAKRLNRDIKAFTRGKPIPQREDRAYEIIEGEVKAISRLDGTSIFVSKGPAAIWENFGEGNYPEYFAFIDGCLLGMYFQDIV